MDGNADDHRPFAIGVDATVALESAAAALQAGADLDAVRHTIAAILAKLLAARPALTERERVNLEMAIRLLPTAWLPLCLTHIGMALFAADDEEFDAITDPVDAPPGRSRDDLIARLEALGYLSDRADTPVKGRTSR